MLILWVCNGAGDAGPEVSAPDAEAQGGQCAACSRAASTSAALGRSLGRSLGVMLRHRVGTPGSDASRNGGGVRRSDATWRTPRMAILTAEPSKGTLPIRRS